MYRPSEPYKSAGEKPPISFVYEVGQLWHALPLPKLMILSITKEWMTLEVQIRRAESPKH